MSRLHPGITPYDLGDHPELAVLQVLDSALEVAKFAIIAVHLELTDTDQAAAPSDIEALAADHVLIAVDALQRAIASYRAVIQTDARGLRRPPMPIADDHF